MKNFLFFKAFYEGNTHYLCDFYESVPETGSPQYEINVETDGKQIICTVSKAADGTWEVHNKDTGLDGAVEDRLLRIILENKTEKHERKPEGADNN